MKSAMRNGTNHCTGKGLSFALFVTAFLSSCGGHPSATQLVVTWNPNHEAAVNSKGGGYRVYYSSSSGVDTTSAKYIDVPYVSGPQAPTTVIVPQPQDQNYYFRVIAYSPFTSGGGTSVRRSSDSKEVSIQFP